ncbi:MAG: DNA-processing protein DprA [Woeseiaceae bacterium]|nr:DNA-processing protein DprA [Woeseiaceae bacterium]
MPEDRQITDWLAAPDHFLIEADSADMPELLAQIADPPTLLYVSGNKEVLHLPALAIVGSRNPTRGGIQNAYEFAHHLASAGFCIVSGLAQGIDTAAHKGALDAGGKTVAFLGHGIDRVYPAENRELAQRISETGALCSEYPIGSPPRREHFPQRNRLISGLCLGTLVVEAARRSGSLISARLAAEQGREIFALPGSIHNPLSRGCHQLIRQGAKLVECAGDIVSELGPLAGHLAQSGEIAEGRSTDDTPHDADYETLLSALSYDPASADQIASSCGLTIDQVSSMLLILELEGKVQMQAGGRYSISRASEI